MEEDANAYAGSAASSADSLERRMSAALESDDDGTIGSMTMPPFRIVQRPLSEDRGLLQDIGESLAQAAVRLLKTPLEATGLLAGNGLTWKDVKPIVDAMSSISEIIEAARDLNKFLCKCAKIALAIFVKMALHAAKAALEHFFGSKGLDWSDVIDSAQALAEMLSSPGEVEALLADPEAFLKR